ncbi:MAG: cyanophycin synthetase [Chloroflexota bacterium]
MSRPPEEIGAGLQPARAAVLLRPGERIHVVGAGGAAGAAAALHAHHAGAAVSGCDTGGASQYTRPLERVGIPLAWEHAPSHVVAGDEVLVDRLAVTKALTAVAPDHAELLAARTRGIPATSLQQLIADAAATHGQALVGIAGTHGKSTTTGWVVQMLVQAGLDPSAFVGALLPPALVCGPDASTVRVGDGRHFVVEADEYAGNFDAYRPALGGLTNADWDHPDVFADRAAVVAAFAAWVRQFDGGGDAPVLVANVGDAGVRDVLANLRDWPGRLLVVRVVEGGEDPDAVCAALEQTHATAGGPARAIVGRWRHATGEGILEIAGLGDGAAMVARLALPGRHNAENGLVAAGVAVAAGAAPEAIARGLATFAGVGRRLELKGDLGGITVLDDYGHHPTAMAATFATVRERYPGRRLWAVYEPLTYHRTAAMLGEFAAVLEKADRVVIAQVHAGRDPDTTIASARALADAVAARGQTPAWAPGTVEETADWLTTRVKPGDVVLVMGGGRSYVIAERLVAYLRERARG